LITEAGQLVVWEQPGVFNRSVLANKIVSTMFDGHAVVITFGCGRILPERTEEQPKEGATICVNCRIALSPPAAIELVNSIKNMMTAVQDAQRKNPAA
jgi:hypothetical protein